MARSNEPVWWGPFMAGAGLSALFMPALIIVTGSAVAAGWISEKQLFNFVGNPLVRVLLLLLIALSLFHAAHRLRFVLVDLGLKAISGLIAVLCYGGAIAGTIITALVALRLM